MEYGQQKTGSFIRVYGTTTRETAQEFIRRKMDDSMSNGTNKIRRQWKLKFSILKKDQLQKKMKKIINYGRIKSWKVKPKIKRRDMWTISSFSKEIEYGLANSINDN